MFYSHEILTSRKYGVATVWLVATLGSKSALKKVDRKAINNVNVPKACEVIVEPQAPMALRLQSNLLYGVSTVYSQQCGYVLVDAQSLQNHMRQMLRTVQSAGNELDPEAGRTRPDLLLLPDDPNFLPDFAFANLAQEIGLEDLDLGTSGDSSDGSRLISPGGSRSSRTSVSSAPDIRLPSSDGFGGDLGGLGGYDFGGSEMSGGGRLSSFASGALGRLDDNEGFLPEVDFSFDAEGNIVENPTRGEGGQHEAAAPGLRAPSDASALDRTREHEAVRLAQVQQAQDEEPLGGMMDDDNNDYAQPSPASPLPDHQQPPQPPHTPPPHDSSASNASAELSSSTLQAPARRKRPAKKPAPVPRDTVTQLPSVELRHWNRDYLLNMRLAAEEKVNEGATALAKKNALAYVYDIGVWGAQSGGAGLAGQLREFRGERLREVVLGIQRPAAQQGQKRDHDSASGAGTPSRRVRPRSSVEGARADAAGEDMQMQEEEGMAVMEDEDRLPEEGRAAPTPLADGDHPSSVMPWNASASQRSSVLPGARGSRLPLSRQGSVTSRGRLTSASPLLGRGSMLNLSRSRQGSLQPGPGSRPGSGMLMQGADPSSGGAFYGGDDFGGMGSEDQMFGEDAGADYERYGPAANVETQLAAQSQWIRQALDQEAENFLSFVQAAIDERTARVEEDVEGLEPALYEDFSREYESQNDAELAKEIALQRMREGKIAFGELLTEEGNSKVVAAQGLLHVLTLATKGVLSVKQDEGFGDIELGVLSKVGKDVDNYAFREPEEGEEVQEAGHGHERLDDDGDVEMGG